MARDVLWMLLKCFGNAAMVLLVAPLCQGVMRRITARIQSRQGPPLLQPYVDLLKLLGKEDIESGESPVMQRLAAYLALSSVLVVACLVPMGFASPMNRAADVIVLIYLLALCGICTLFAGLAAGSTYSLIGISREMMTMIALEPLLVIALVIGAIHVQSFRLDRVLGGSVYALDGVPWSGLIILVVMVFAFQAFVQRVPFDIAEAETEIMEGPLMEYSGPKLALFKYAQMCRLVIHGALFVALFVPFASALPFPFGWLVFWAKILVLILAVTLVAATHARYRIDQAIRYFAAMIVVAFGALVLASFGT
ncbi:MAG: complex I subunit 1 family protein [Tepidisphaeraceae bacterium]|jgi:formate hydrogenlyase subunit 4